MLTLLGEISSLAALDSTIEVFAVAVLDCLRSYWGGCKLQLLLVDPCGKLVVPGVRPHPTGAGTRQWPAASQLLLKVADEGVPQRVDEISVKTHRVEYVAGIRSLLAVPLKIGERVVGVLCATSDRAGVFDGVDESTMVSLAPMVAVACENRLLTREVARRRRDAQTLCRLADEMSIRLDGEGLLDYVVTHLREAIGCRGCSIALLESGDEVLRIRAAVGITAEWRRDFELKLGKGVAGRVAQAGTPEYVPDAFEVDDFIFFDPSIRSLLTVPIRSNNKTVGTLSVDSDRPYAFSAADESLLCVAAVLVATALENGRLYTELEKWADDLELAYQELRILDRRKDEMVQNVSHELRTPLTFVKGYVDLLLVEEIGQLNGDQRRFLDIVARKTTEVIGKVRDLIFLQQVDYLPVVRSPVYLTDLVRQAQIAVRWSAERVGVTVISDMPKDIPPVDGDEEALLQVLEHLLDNAVKFSPEGSEVRVIVEDTDNVVRVSVADQGKGIPKDLHDQIFEPFYQVDGSTRRHFGGCGIGLSVARRIVEGHGGEIGVMSNGDGGSTFFFTVPKYKR